MVRMIVGRHLSRAAIVSLAVAMLAAACSKDTPAVTTTPSCAFSVVQPTTTFGPEGGTGSANVTVTAGTGCTWTTISSAAFVTISQGASSTGSGAATFAVAVNTGAERTATLTVAGSAFTITQRAAVASPTLTAPTASSPINDQTIADLRPSLVITNAVSTGAVGTVTYRFEVTDTDTFPDNPLRTITQDGVAQGSGTTSWLLPRDLGPGGLYFWRARATNGTLTTAFSAVATFRTAAPSCSFALTPSSLSVAASGGSSTITVATSSACSWAAVSNAGFITIASASSGTGNGSVTFSAAANTGAARTGTLTIGNQTVTVSQAAGTGTGVVASFQLFDSAAQASPTTECRFRSATGAATTCTLRSTSFTLGTNVIASQSWTVQYVYNAAKTITGTDPNLSFTDTCGQLTSTDDGASQALQVTLTVTDNNGVVSTATSGSGSQPALFVRLYTCGF